jgi:hypothetical protein
MRKVMAFLVLSVFVVSACAFASSNAPLKNIGKGLDDMVYGDIEIPKSIDQTKTKGAPAYEKCTKKTNDDFGRGVTRFVGGFWRVATFWYPEDEPAAK